MIVAGYLAEYPELTNNKFLRDKKYNPEQIRKFWYAISFAAMIGIFIYITKWHNYLRDQGIDTKTLLYFFYIGWSLYALNFLNPSESARQHIFDILDLFNKGIYSLVLEKTITDKFV